MTVVVPEAEFWRFKAKCAELDLEAVRLRARLSAVDAAKDRLVIVFGAAHGLNGLQPIDLDDVAFTASQGSS